MPIYDYTCTVCHNTFEHLARRMDEAPPPCPACGAKKTTKGLSSFAVRSGSSSARSTPLPTAGGCCPCGKTAGSCARG